MTLLQIGLSGSFVLGACIGSFLNVCIWRIPRGEDIVFTPSHCPKCNKNIRWYENIPLFSYIFLRGKCSGCKQPISFRYFALELLTGILFAAAFLAVYFNYLALSTSGLYFMAITLAVPSAVIDWKHRIIPDLLTIPGCIGGVVYCTLFPEALNDVALTQWWQGGGFALLSCLGTGAALALFALAGKALFGREALGWGDVKFMAAAGALCGWHGAFFTLLAGCIGALFYAAFFMSKKRRRKGVLSFGPFMAGGMLLWIYFGAGFLSVFYY